MNGAGRWAVGAALVLWVPQAAVAAELQLPEGASPADWQDALMVSGLAHVPGTARIEGGPPWTLVVRRPDGDELRRSIPPPTTPQAREATAILAASILRPLRVPIALPPPPPTPRIPAPQPTPAPVPAPPPAPPAASTPMVVAAPAPRLAVSGVLGAAGRATLDQGVGLGTLGSCTVQGSGPLFIDVGASWVWTPRTDVTRPDRDLVVSSVWTGMGWIPRTGWPGFSATFGGSGRRYRYAAGTVASVNVPWLGAGLTWDPPPLDGTRGGVRVIARMQSDLRTTILENTAGEEGAVSPWGLMVAVAGRWGPSLGARDTPATPPPAARKNSPSE